MPEDVEDCLRAGFSCHLHKPVAVKTLLQAIEQCGNLEHEPVSGGHSQTYRQ
jgi:CheY-like chemotaxis protein